MKRDYHIRQVITKKEILQKPRQQSLKFLPISSKSKILTEPVDIRTSSVLKLSQPDTRSKSKRKLQGSFDRHQDIRCSWCQSHKAQYSDAISSLQETLRITKKWRQGNLTNNQMLITVQSIMSHNNTIKQTQQTILQLMYDVDSLSKVDIEKFLQIDQFQMSDANITVKIDEAKIILDQLKKQFDDKANKQFQLNAQTIKSTPEIVIRNLKARLGFVLRQYKQLKKQNKISKYKQQKLILIK